MESKTEQENLSAVKNALMRVVRNILGEKGEFIAEKLRTAPNSREGLAEAIAGCRRSIREFVDDETAERLESRCKALLKPYGV